ncbi:MAG: hypothetical protein ACLFRH_07060, partial [Halothiobacillaceae bacterium]
MRMSLNRLILLSLTTLFLSACGGGDSAFAPGEEPVSEIEVIAQAGSPVVGTGERTTIQATVTDSEGKPIPNRSVSFALGSNISGAALSDERARTSSNGQASVLYTAGSQLGLDRVNVSVLDESGNELDFASVEIEVSRDAQSSLSLALPTEVEINAGNSLVLEAQVSTDEDEPAPNQTVQFAFGSNLSGARLSPVEAVSGEDGIARVIYTAGSDIDGLENVIDTVIATTEDDQGREVSAFSNIQVLHAETGVSIALAADASELGTGETTALTATLTDSEGQPITNRTVSFTIGSNESGGQTSAGSATTGNDGTARVVYTAGNSEGTDTLIASYTTQAEILVATSVDLQVDPASSQTGLQVSLTPETFETTPGSAQILTASVTASDGNPEPGEEVSFQFGSNISGATLESDTAITDEDGDARIRYTAGSEGGVDTVIVTVTDSNGRTTADYLNIDVAEIKVGSVRILARQTTIGTNDPSGVPITVEVKSQDNVLMPDIPVSLSASDGSLEMATNVTNASGVVLANLSTEGMFDNGQIQLNASAGNVDAESLELEVTGTQLALDGPSAATVGDTVDYEVTLQDSRDRGIPNQLVSLDTTSGTLLEDQVETDSNGEASFSLVADQDADVSATANGATGLKALSVGNVSIEITSPTAGEILDIDPQSHTVTAAVTPAASGTEVTLSTTRGFFPPPDDAEQAPSAIPLLTDANGEVSATLKSTTSGPARIYATTSGGVTTNAEVIFSAPTATKINLQAEPSVVPVGESSTLTVALRDDKDNIVAGKRVDFVIMEDTSNGTLSRAAATTDEFGRASVTFNAGPNSTADDGVTIRARVEEDDIETTETLTVASRSLFVRLGTDNTLTVDNPNFRKTYSILVTDAAGAPV